VLLDEKKISKEQNLKKFGQKKKRINSKKREEKRKQAHKEHLNSSIICGAFSPYPYFRCNLSYLFHFLICHN
jgi:hypothetical protein